MINEERLKIITGDCRELLKELASDSVHCCVTSPPYWGLRDYGVDGQIGLEKTPEEYVQTMVGVFREIRRVLRKDGTCWVNLGDCYASSGQSGKQDGVNEYARRERGEKDNGPKQALRIYGRSPTPDGLKPKDLVGIPWRVAFALQADGWWLRQDIIWAKPNPMPESVTDRCTKAHEYIFLLSKSARYYYDADAIKEPPNPELIQQIEQGYNGEATKDCIGQSVQDASQTKSRIIDSYRKKIDKHRGHSSRHAGFNDRWDHLSKYEQMMCGCNKCDVWTVPTSPYPEAHFATYPPDLIKPCILAGCPAGGVVLDPFGGSGTTGQVALELGRKAILIELNPKYAELAEQRTFVTPGLAL